MSASSEYFATVQTLALRALSTVDPTISKDNVLLWGVPYTWNNGEVVRPSNTFATLDVCSKKVIYNYDHVDAVWPKKKAVENFVATRKEPVFLVVHFYGDHAFAYTRLRPFETYKVSTYESLRIPTQELTHVLTLTEEEERQAQSVYNAAKKAENEKLAARRTAKANKTVLEKPRLPQKPADEDPNHNG